MFSLLVLPQPRCIYSTVYDDDNPPPTFWPLWLYFVSEEALVPFLMFPYFKKLLAFFNFLLFCLLFFITGFPAFYCLRFRLGKPHLLGQLRLLWPKSLVCRVHLFVWQKQTKPCFDLWPAGKRVRLLKLTDGRNSGTVCKVLWILYALLCWRLWEFLGLVSPGRVRLPYGKKEKNIKKNSAWNKNRRKKIQGPPTFAPCKAKPNPVKKWHGTTESCLPSCAGW